MTRIFVHDYAAAYTRRGASEVLRRAGRHAAWRSSKRGRACIGKQPQIAVPSTIALRRIRFGDW